MAVRKLCSAIVSGSLIPASHQPVRLARLSRPISYRKPATPSSSGSTIQRSPLATGQRPRSLHGSNRVGDLRKFAARQDRQFTEAVEQRFDAVEDQMGQRGLILEEPDAAP